MKPTLVTAISPSRHLAFVLKEAQDAFAAGDFQKGVSNLSHAVFVAATDGKGILTETDLILELRKVAGFGYEPEGGEVA